MEISLQTDLDLVIGLIYALNQDNPLFINNLSNLIEEYENPNILLEGDWNSTRNFTLDNLNYISQNNLRMTQAINNLMYTFNLVDAWRVYNPTKKQFTWLQGLSNKQSRLDYFLCNEELLSITNNLKINPKYRSDHAPISCHVTINPEQRGPNTWKLNNSLLLDKQFNTLVRKCINNIKKTYSVTPYNPEFIDSATKDLDLMISKTLFWETLLVTFRGEIIRYAKRKNRMREHNKKQLEDRISTLDSKVTSGNSSREEQLTLAQLNTDLQNIHKEELKGAYVRSRADWIEHGEKPSKLFLNLENKNRVNKNISEIKLDDQTTITNQNEILVCLRNFYSDLYKAREMPTTETNYEIHPNRLNQKEKDRLENPITKKEIDDALAKMKNNKSPGLDGYSAEFYKKILASVRQFLPRMYQ